MKKIGFLFLLLMLSQLCWSQIVTKEITGDTTFWEKWYEKERMALELKDLISSKDDFNFRFWNEGQVVDLWTVKDSIGGQVTNYAYKLKKDQYRTKKLLFSKSSLDSETLQKAISFLINSHIDTIPSGSKIENWSLGLDGITYILETANSTQYAYKSYWTPTAQDSLKEAIIVQDFVDSFSNILKLESIFLDYKSTLIPYGCYSFGGNMISCYKGNSFGGGYASSLRLPVGYVVDLNLYSIGRLRTRLSFNLQHQFGKNNKEDFILRIDRGKLIFRKNKKLSDFITYQFRKKEFNFIDFREFRSDKFLYGLNIENLFSLAGGVDVREGEVKEKGLALYISKYFTKQQFSVSSTATILEGVIDFKVILSKRYLNQSFVFTNGLNVGLYFESINKTSDLGLTLNLGF